MTFRRRLFLGLALLSGCNSPGPHPPDLSLKDLTSHTWDNSGPTSLAQPNDRQISQNSEVRPAAFSAAEVASADNPGERPQPRPLVPPADLPGSDAPPIVIPTERSEQEAAIRKLYPTLPALPADLILVPGPDGHALSLSDLQTMAFAHSPSIRNAVAGVEAARGAVRQAHAYPNPSVAWEADTVGTGGGYQGAYIDQPIKGFNKLKLAQASAEMDLRNAELALHRAETDLANQVRTAYFQVLVARENIKVSKALAAFTDRIYAVQVNLVVGQQSAAYEPMQLRPLALQARLNLSQARSQFLASWRQLAAALGLPGMPPTEIVGRVDAPVPVFDHDAVLNYIVEHHTDVLTALTSVQKARYQYQLAKVTPYPDFDVHVLIQKDYTTPPNYLVYSGALSMTLPVWDQNQGGIGQALGQLKQSQEQVQTARLQLIATLADAFNRYTTARETVDVSLQQVRDQIRAYRAAYDRHQGEPDKVGFGDLVTAQQTLATYITGYITALGLQWQAVVDLANLLQTDDLYQGTRSCPVAPVPELDPSIPSCVPAMPVKDATGPSAESAKREVAP
jgi:cobalt-zinc-cadmium efflux system outer membrane protein